jgi:ATP/maltotriose-dependent transcriptional regulator MalT
VPEGITIIAISRAEPPAELARLVAGGRIARIDEAELRCTRTKRTRCWEASPSIRSFSPASSAKATAGSRRSFLLREHLRRRGATLDESLGNGKDAIFQYFAGEIFNGARPENQRVLMLSAIPPSITGAEAVELSGSDDAPRLLEYLYRHHLFTDRRHGGQVTYHYHALFREFLLQELAVRIAPHERRTVTARAGHLLSARGLQSDALALFRAAGEWDAMRTLIHAHALEWARQGRAQTLSDWIEALPAAMRDADPWLAYWFGRAWIFVEPRKGRPAIERSYAAFRATGDVRGQALALSAIVNSYYYEWATFKPLDRWLPELERLFSHDAPQLDAASELRARAALLVTLLFRKPDDAAAAPCAQRLDELLDGEADLTVRVMAASILLNYINWTHRGRVRGRARRAHRADRAQAGSDAADAGVVGIALLALALHQRAATRKRTTSWPKHARSPSATVWRSTSSTSTTRMRPRSSTRAITRPPRSASTSWSGACRPRIGCCGRITCTCARSSSNAWVIGRRRRTSPSAH